MGQVEALYQDVCNKFDKYLCVEKRFKAETDYFQRQQVQLELDDARNVWSQSLADYRNYISHVNQKAKRIATSIADNPRSMFKRQAV